MLTEIKSVLNNLRMSGAEITRKVVIAVRNDVSVVVVQGKWLKMVVPKPLARNILGKKDRNNCEKRDESR